MILDTETADFGDALRMSGSGSDIEIIHDVAASVVHPNARVSNLTNDLCASFTGSRFAAMLLDNKRDGGRTRQRTENLQFFPQTSSLPPSVCPNVRTCECPRQRLARSSSCGPRGHQGLPHRPSKTLRRASAQITTPISHLLASAGFASISNTGTCLPGDSKWRVPREHT